MSIEDNNKKSLITDCVKQIGETIKRISISQGADINHIGFQAIFMLLKYEIGQYFLNKTIGKNYKISEKGKYICEEIYNITHKAILEKVKEIPDANPFEKGYIVSECLKLIGEKLYKDNYLG